MDALPGLKTFDMAGLRPVFEPIINEAALPNMNLKLDSGRVMSSRQGKRTLVHLDQPRRAAEQLVRLPAPNETRHLVLNGSYPLFALVPACIKLAGAPITMLYIVTLGFSKENIADLSALVDSGQVRDVAIAASTYFGAQDKPIYDSAVEFCGRHGFRIKALRSHAKLLLMHIGRRFYTVESSANMRSCRNVETACVFNSRKVFRFHQSWLDELLARAK
jgi:hypothetical protein